MARTYTLTATSVNAGMHNGWTNGDWNSFFSANALAIESERRPYVGRRGSSSPYTYRAVNILFDQSVLATLRTKAITSIKLTVTLVYGTLYANSTAYKIGYKLDAQASTSSAGSAWTRSDADSTAASSTDVAGYLSTSNRIESDNDNVQVTVDLTGSTIPRYGYTIGTDQGLNASIILGATATLTVVTNESLTLSFNANGGSGVPSSQTADGNPNHTFAIPSTVPTRQYYTFLGWSTSSSATSASYSAGGSITISANTTLYAVWSRNTAYVYYNANNGSGAPSATSHSEGTNVTLSSTKPTRTGYNFLGWSTSSSSSSASYAAGGTYALYTTVTLYAVWERITYTVSYNANGGSGAPGNQTKTYDVTLTLSSTTPSRTGYTFLGWSTSNTATSATYQPGGSFTANANTTLYAVWQIITYSVTFNANGGTGAPAAQAKTYGVDLTLSSTIPTRTNYAFLGWSTNSSATTAEYAAGGSYTANAAAVLYAVWKLNAVTVTITYDANSGTGAPSAQSKTDTAPIGFTLSSTVPTRTGYAFKGWATSATATSAAYQPGASVSLSNSITLYAVWQAYKVTVRYHANGAAIAATHGSGYAVDADGYVTYNGNRDFHTVAYGNSSDPYNIFNSSAVNLAYAGHYVTDGSEWNTAADGSETSFDQDISYAATAYASDVTTGDRTIVLYANWKIYTYPVTYNANGGTGAPAAQTKEYGTALTLSSASPSRAGYNFLGWATSASSETVAYAAGATYAENAALTLYAVWQRYYTVAYDANGGEGAPDAQQKIEGTDIQLSATVPTRTGFAFFGWSTDSAAFNATWQPSDTYSTDADMTLYAVWRALYSVSYDANGGTGAPAAQTKTQGVDLVLSAIEPTYSGKTFMSWQGSDGRSYNAGDTYTGDANLVLTAVWNNFNKGSAYLVTNGVAHAVDVYVVENGVFVQKDIYV